MSRPRMMHLVGAFALLWMACASVSTSPGAPTSGDVSSADVAATEGRGGGDTALVEDAPQGPARASDIDAIGDDASEPETTSEDSSSPISEDAAGPSPCPEGWARPSEGAECAPLAELCAIDNPCLLPTELKGGLCQYTLAEEGSSCEGTSDEPCVDGFTCQAGTCDPLLPACEEGPRPVVFVHGINGGAAEFDIMKGRLVAAGWAPDELVAFQADDPSWGCNVDNAEAIAALVDDVLASSCAARVDLVAHSMGTLSSRHFLKFLGGTERVNTYVTLGGMHHGIASACLAPDFLGVCVWQEICETGAFVTDLNAEPATPGALHWVSIYGTADAIVPNSSSILDGAENISIDGAEHVGPNGLLEREDAFAEVERVLEYGCW